jgi:choline dehydrogenase-like flavoprotein
MTELDADVIIIGTGAGGGTMAYALMDSGARVLLLERGDFLPVEAQNWSPEATVELSRYKPNDYWEHRGRLYRGSNHYYVGGMTKMFGACLARLRPADFEEYGLDDGVSPAWPIAYDDLEPYYGEAERIWGVRGDGREDPMEPPRSSPYPYPALEHGPDVALLAERLRDQGLHPYTLPMGVAVGGDGNCISCRYCDGFTCPLHAKCDADVRCVRPALRSDNVSLQTHAYAERLLTDPSGRRVTAVEVRIQGELRRARADQFVVSAGGVNTAALFLRSSSPTHPNGLANSSDLVGRNYIQHRDSALSGVDPRRVNDTAFQKTLGVNDFYLSPDGRHPRLGSLQLTGKVLHQHIRGVHPWLPRRTARWIAAHSVDWWLMTEDCPLPENRIVLAPNGRIRLEWRATSVQRHRRLVRKTARMMQRAGYPIVVWSHFGIDVNAHQASTMRMGTDPRSSVLDPLCRPHDLDNVHVVDASFLPSLGAGPGGPTLTIAAMALRVAHQAGLARAPSSLTASTSSEGSKNGEPQRGARTRQAG